MADKNTFEGTTTVGITCVDGVVFASERRASMGNLVAHKVAEKIFKIDNHIAATIAGSVAGAQSLMKIISAETALYRLRNGKDISIEAAASVSSNILHSSPAYVQTLIGGVDDTGASIYSLDAAGGMIKDTFISTGSGSTFAYGVLEDRYRPDLTVEEGKELAVRAITAAMERDVFSGNSYRLATITEDEMKIYTPEEIAEIKEQI